MKIVVLAGGISTERDVSLSSGSEIYKALKRKGHQVILVDLFLGLPGVHGHLEELFDSEIDWAASIRGVSEKAPDLYEVKARRPGYRSILGPNVLELCSLCDIVFLGLHGEGGRPRRIGQMLHKLDRPYAEIIEQLTCCLCMVGIFYRI